jgi:hypothetical protein
VLVVSENVVSRTVLQALPLSPPGDDRLEFGILCRAIRTHPHACKPFLERDACGDRDGLPRGFGKLAGRAVGLRILY